MNIKEAKQEIINTVIAYNKKDDKGNYIIPYYRQRPILLMGPPGIGKTRIMEQIADELDIGLASYALTHHTRQSALGLPAITEKEFKGKRYKATEYTMSEIIAGIYKVMKETGRDEGILFLDEINCVSETLMPAMLQLLQQKSFGGAPIPEGWVITAAGNPPEYNRLARNFDIVTLDRVRLINVEPDIRVWTEYAENSGVCGSVMAFLTLKNDYLFRMNRDVDGLTYATPRGWEDLSAIIQAYEREGIPVTEEIIKEFIQDGDAAEDMHIYLELYNRYKDDYHIDDILFGEAPASVYERLLDAPLDERISLIRLLLDRIKKEETPDDAIKSAFAFIEETMGVGNEMLLFVTGLTETTDIVIHLMINPLPEYTKYSEELLGDSKRSDLLSRIN